MSAYASKHRTRPPHPRTGEASTGRLSMAPTYDPGGHRATLVSIAGEAQCRTDEGVLLSDKVIFQRARRASHPDTNDGDLTRWHLVETAGRALGLVESRCRNEP